MLHMTFEEIRSLINSHQERMQMIGAVPTKLGEKTSISASIFQGENGKFFIIFDTPMGLIKMKSARKMVREFASSDSAMAVVKQCGYTVATIFCRGE